MTSIDPDGPATVMRHAAGRLRAEAAAWLPETWPEPFATLLEAVANLADLTHDYDTGDDTVTTAPTTIEVAAYGAALAYLGEATP